MLNLIDRISSLLTGQAIGLTIPSYADFTGFFLAASSFFALAHTHREGGHIRVSQMAWAGLGLNLLAVMLISLGAYFLLPYIFPV